MTRYAQKGFTLAELLIALAILGVIATFTIPKILTSTGTAQFKAVSKEAASIVSGAFQDFAVSNAVSTTTTFDNMLANVNYVSINTTATEPQSGLDAGCTAGTPCLLLHNGGLLQYSTTHAFGATANYITVKIDPDGLKSGSSTDIVTFNLFYNGQLRDIANTTGTSGTVGSALLAQDTPTPTWATNLWQ